MPQPLPPQSVPFNLCPSGIRFAEVNAAQRQEYPAG